MSAERTAALPTRERAEIRVRGALGAPWATPLAPAPTPRIQLVHAPSQPRSRIPFVLLCMALLIGALVGALILNTTMARGAYEERELQTQIAQFAQIEQSLLTALDQEAAPTALAKRARSLGMVQDPTPAYIRLADGKIIGDPTPAIK